jgi:hypothetical protein
MNRLRSREASKASDNRPSTQSLLVDRAHPPPAVSRPFDHALAVLGRAHGCVTWHSIARDVTP